jgi:hypothetical protein
MELMQLGSNVQGIAFFPPEGGTLEGGATFAISAESLSNITWTKSDMEKFLAEDKNYIIEQYSNNKTAGFKLLESNMTTLDGNPAYKLVYLEKRGVGTEPEKEIKYTELFSHANVRYDVLFGADTNTYNHYEPTFQKMVDSIKLPRMYTLEHFTKYNFTNTYNLSVGNDIFSIKYNLSDGDLLGMDFEEPDHLYDGSPPALHINMSYDIYNSISDKLTIEIPRALLDYKDSNWKDDDFVVSNAGGGGVQNREMHADKNSRILEIYNTSSFGVAITGTTSSLDLKERLNF